MVIHGGYHKVMKVLYVQVIILINIIIIRIDTMVILPR